MTDTGPTGDHRFGDLPYDDVLDDAGNPVPPIDVDDPPEPSPGPTTQPSP